MYITNEREVKQMKKYKINWQKVGRNCIILLNIITIGILIYTIKTKGIEFFSTIGYFG